MIDNLLGGGDDDDDPGESDVDDMDGGLFDDGDDLMGGGDDLMGDDDELMGDDMGFDDMDGGDGATSAEVDNRIDELENEVASLSSTVNTVKSENEQISESVGNVEENVRKLLEVYEMVTRGVNPFVDESDMGDGFGGGTIGDGSMGLFGDDEEESEIDSSVADASADEFFDEEFEDETDELDEFDDLDEDEDDGGVAEAFDADDADVDEFEDDTDEFDAGFDDEEGEAGGKSFEELKAEYDSGEAEWDDNEAGADADGGSSDETGDDGAGDDDLDTSPIDDVGGELDDDLDVEAEDESADESATDTGSSMDGGKPYLEAVPSGYAADIVVMDWLEFLVEEAGVDGAARTIAYYETIEWLDGAAADSLQTFLNGFGGDVEADPEPRSSLTVEHHNASLRYISRITTSEMGMVAFDERNGWGESGSMGGAERVDRHARRSSDPAGRSLVNRAVESDGGRDIDAQEGRRSTRRRPPDGSDPEPRGDGEFDWRDDHVA